MRPIKYTNKNDETIFHYDKEALKGFVHLGRKHGDVGKILTGRTGDILHYAGYGTYENPNKTLNRISVRHSVAFDGEMKSDEEIVLGINSILKVTNRLDLRLLILKNKAHENDRAIHEKDLNRNESIVIGVADSVVNAEKVVKEYYGEFKEIELTHEGDSNIEYIKVVEAEHDNGDICKYQLMLEWFELNKA